MAKTRSMASNQNRDDASSRKRFKTCYNGGAAPWSDLNHNLLFLIMMKLGVIDFLAFGGVCKSWRSLALDNKKIYMSSRPPMLMSISKYYRKKECYLEDFQFRKFKTLLPHSRGRTCVGSTCGYLILFGKKTRDFWLVNPITRHELHFPCFVNSANTSPTSVRAILVFSPLTSWWVFIMLDSDFDKIWFSIAGTRAWSHVLSSFPILDLHAFKGKIYIIDIYSRLCEMRLHPKPKLTLLQTKISPKPRFLHPEFVSLDESLYVMDHMLYNSYKVYQLDFDEMEWVSCDKTTREIAFFVNDLKCSAASKPELWFDHRFQFERFTYFVADKIRKGGFFGSHIWYFLNDCLNVNLLEE